MKYDLLTDFFEQEDVIYICSDVYIFSKENLENNKSIKREFSFNRFILTLDFEKKIATLEDDLSLYDDVKIDLEINFFFTILGKYRCLNLAKVLDYEKRKLNTTPQNSNVIYLPEKSDE